MCAEKGGEGKVSAQTSLGTLSIRSDHVLGHSSCEIALTGIIIYIFIRTDIPIIRLRYRSLDRILPMVPSPKAMKNMIVHKDVTIRPVGNIPNVLPGRTNPFDAVRAADAVAGFATWEACLEMLVNCPATNQAESAAVMLVVTTFCEVGDVACSDI